MRFLISTIAAATATVAAISTIMFMASGDWVPGLLLAAVTALAGIVTIQVWR